MKSKYRIKKTVTCKSITYTVQKRYLFFFYQDMSFCFGENYRNFKRFKPNYNDTPRSTFTNSDVPKAIVKWLSLSDNHMIGFDTTDDNEMICYCFFSHDKTLIKSETTFDRALKLERQHMKEQEKKVYYIYEDEI